MCIGDLQNCFRQKLAKNLKGKSPVFGSVSSFPLRVNEVDQNSFPCFFLDFGSEHNPSAYYSRNVPLDGEIVVIGL